MRGPIFVTGGSGFVGSAVIDELVGRGIDVAALSHRGELPARGGRVRVIKGGLSDAVALASGMEGAAAVIHLVGIIFENRGKGATFEKVHVAGTRSVVEAARRAGVSRYIHMSALGARAGAPSLYHRTKWQAEQIVTESGLEWTILRPSMIHGPRGEFMKMEAGWAKGSAAPYLFMPYFGAGAIGRGGCGKLQPIYVGDVARALVEALDRPQTIGRAYDLGGPEEMTWPQMHSATSTLVVGRARPVLAIPAWYAKLLASVLPAALLPFNRDQVLMSQEDNTADIRPFTETFGWTPRTFVETVRSYVSQL